jgi:inner membrane protein
VVRQAAALAALFALVALGSHGLLDALTDGGLGAALFWPLTAERYFAPVRPIPVAPIGPRIFSMYGLYVIGLEFVIFAPLIWYGLWPRSREPARPPILR